MRVGDKVVLVGRLSRLLGVFAAFHVVAAPIASAREVHVVRFLTEIPSSCPGFGYRDVLLFHNGTTSDKTVVAVGASNGYVIPQGRDLVVPPRRTRAVYIEPFGNSNAGGVENDWAPGFPRPVLLVNRLEVPDGVKIESRGEVFSFGGTEIPCPPPSPSNPGGFPLEVSGHFSMPVISDLTLPNIPHVHLGSDLGTLRSRTNVGIYNAEQTAAQASVEIRSACNDQVLDSVTVEIPADSIAYVQGFENDVNRDRCFSLSTAPTFSRYVVVTMDRSGFSFAATRAVNLSPGVMVGATSAR